MTFQAYETDGFFDEYFENVSLPRDHARLVVDAINALDVGDLQRKQHAAEKVLLQMGITFNVYGDSGGAERIFPFDALPRIVPQAEWLAVERGLSQRVTALNHFIDDIYHDQRIVKDRVVPADLIASAAGFRPQCVGLNPSRGVWCHVTGSDLVRDRDGTFHVLEDNIRTPSGASYMLGNRVVIKRTFPRLFSAARVLPVADYANRLRSALEYLAPDGLPSPRIVVLTPGMYNSAYYEHSFLAQQMGVDLVEGSDLVIDDGYVRMRTTRGLERVDVIYRRIDDDFIDPEAFRPDSMLGVPGLFEVYRSGRVALANAPGTGVADDKVIYAYVPAMIRYYLDEDALLPNVPTYLCWRDVDRRHVLANIESLVVKAANESGGYGMLVGPASTRAECEEFRRRVSDNPRNYIAQPTLALSRVPVLCDGHFEGRHVDLRPYILMTDRPYVTPGGLTRVALQKGSLVVNSSQGGGSKDTWIVPGEATHA
ncbi:MAG: circularly permuted type 2 ATP-grasp protein [Spirochaetaceae bacterium]|nr:MAG: circularly permuted type 2 ATP-grasp protein [Spirochaetaceae bacterium]